MYVYECLSHTRRGSATVLMSRRVSHYTSWLILGFFQGDRRADGYRVGRYIYIMSVVVETARNAERKRVVVYKQVYL